LFRAPWFNETSFWKPDEKRRADNSISTSCAMRLLGWNQTIRARRLLDLSVAPAFGDGE
jgi:hypothetical protein